MLYLESFAPCRLPLNRDKSERHRRLNFNLRSFPFFFLYPFLFISLGPKWRIEESHTKPLATFSMFLTLVFLVEVIMKNIAFTPRGYWQSRRNRYDLLVTVVGVIWIIIHCTMKVRLSRCQVHSRSRRAFSSCPYPTRRVEPVVFSS